MLGLRKTGRDEADQALIKTQNGPILEQPSSIPARPHDLGDD